MEAPIHVQGLVLYSSKKLVDFRRALKFSIVSETDSVHSPCLLGCMCVCMHACMCYKHTFCMR